jgi:TrmH family RNA methyltransferase
MIDSPQNQHVKLFRSLAEAKHRRETGLFALEGRRLIQEALQAGAELVWAAYDPEQFTGPEADRVLLGLIQAGVEVLEITPRALAAMSHTESPPGIAAVARIKSGPASPPLPASRLSPLASSPAWALGAWEIRDPGNMGTLVRIAHALGAEAVIALGHCVDFYDPKVVRASMGSVLWVPLLEVALPAKAGVAPIIPGDWHVVAADMAAPVACDEAEYPERCLLLVGSEAHGLPEAALCLAELLVSIPMPGGAESLNAAVAAGIIAFQISRKLARPEAGK